jgi:hypothetical protein
MERLIPMPVKWSFLPSEKMRSNTEARGVRKHLSHPKICFLGRRLVGNEFPWTRPVPGLSPLDVKRNFLVAVTKAESSRRESETRENFSLFASTQQPRASIRLGKCVKLILKERKTVDAFGSLSVLVRTWRRPRGVGDVSQYLISEPRRTAAKSISLVLPSGPLIAHEFSMGLNQLPS